MACGCPIGRLPSTDVSDVDAALRRVGAEGAESLRAISRRTGIAVATLSRHRSGCLDLGSAPAVPPPPPGAPGAPGTAGSPEEHPAGEPAAQQDKAISARSAAGAAGTPEERPGTSRSPFANLGRPKDDALTAPRKLVAAQVERRCLELRIAGKTYAEIAEVVCITEDTALDTVERVLLRTRGQADSLAEGARALELARCDAIIASYWERATDPKRSIGGGDEDGGGSTYDPSQDKAGAVLLKAMERRAKLLGLDSHNVNVRVEQLPEVQNLFRILIGALEQEPDPMVKARVLGRVRASLAGGRGGTAALPAPQVIEMRPEAPAGAGDG
jgi:DNA-binding CsgD family transcriptional regulator